MPSTPEQLLSQRRLSRHDRVAWGTVPTTTSPGVYVVHADEATPSPRFVTDRLHAWLERAPKMTLHHQTPDAKALRAYLHGYWLADERVLYIGTATSLRARLGQFFRHRLGDTRPHRGGHWLLTLTALDRCGITYARAESPADAKAGEGEALRRFVRSVSDQSRAAHPNPELPLPFANMVHADRRRKQTALQHQVRHPRTH